MSKIKVHWFLPTGGDSRDVLPDPDRPGQRAPTTTTSPRWRSPRTSMVSTPC
jgi:hypothetical protein